MLIRYNDEQRKVYRVKKTHGHSSRSVRKVREAKFRLTEDEKNAILWHMGGEHIYQYLVNFWFIISFLIC